MVVILPLINDILPLITITVNYVLLPIIWQPQHNSCNKQKKKKSKPNDNNRPKPSDLNVAIIKLEGSRSCNEELQRRWQSSEDIARSDFGVGYQPAKKTSDITLRASQCWLENYVDGNEIKFDGGDSSLGQDTAWVVSRFFSQSTRSPSSLFQIFQT